MQAFDPQGVDQEVVSPRDSCRRNNVVPLRTDSNSVSRYRQRAPRSSLAALRSPASIESARLAPGHTAISALCGARCPLMSSFFHRIHVSERAAGLCADLSDFCPDLETGKTFWQRVIRRRRHLGGHYLGPPKTSFTLVTSRRRPDRTAARSRGLARASILAELVDRRTFNEVLYGTYAV